jgi:hypothetical protein
VCHSHVTTHLLCVCGGRWGTDLATTPLVGALVREALCSTRRRSTEASLPRRRPSLCASTSSGAAGETACYARSSPVFIGFIPPDGENGFPEGAGCQWPHGLVGVGTASPCPQRRAESRSPRSSSSRSWLPCAPRGRLRGSEHVWRSWPTSSGQGRPGPPRARVKLPGRTGRPGAPGLGPCLATE